MPILKVLGTENKRGTPHPDAAADLAVPGDFGQGRAGAHEIL
jgi:hypothetical protein